MLLILLWPGAEEEVVQLEAGVAVQVVYYKVLLVLWF
jgi:hypothetical protein